MDIPKLSAKVKEWLGIRRDPEITYYLDRTNMRVGTYTSVMVLLFELVMLVNVMNYAGKNVPEESRTVWIISHTVAYLLMILASSLMLIHAYRFLKNISTDHRSTVAVVTLYSLVFSWFGMYISYHDYQKGEQIFIFVAMMSAACGLFVLPPLYSITYLIISFAGFFAALQKIAPASTAMRINYFTLLVILIITTLSRYNESRFMAKNQLAVTHLSLYDALTGAKNRHSMTLDRKGRVGKEQFMLVADIDDFKFYNDREGHEAGDGIIKEVVEIAGNLKLQGSLRAKKDVYRINGDEVCIIMEGITLEEAGRFGEHFAAEVRRIERKGYVLYLTLSCGLVYGVPANEDDLDEFYRYADRRMFEAKKEGGDRLLAAAFEELKEADELRGLSVNSVYEKDDADPLTGLPTMMRFRDRAQKIMADKNKSFEPYAFIFFNIVNFKVYNERYGFQNGDLLIKQFGTIILDAFPDCLVSRFGGEEFVVVAPLDKLIDRIEEVHHSVHAIQQETHLEVKAGIYQPAEGETNVSIACDRAKIVCDSIKHAFELHYKYYDDSMMRELKKRQYIVDTIDEAIENGYIQLYYQPVVRAISEELCGFEVLARWNDPRFGFLQPKDFIDVLEQNRLIYKIDRFVARQACRDARDLHDRGYPVVPLSFNISRVDFELCDMVGIVEDAVEEFGLPKDLVHVEITESALIDNENYLRHEIQRFHDRGYQVWMDDFGSGYSSLNSLQDFRFDVLKIDMIFLKNYESNQKARKILASVVDMCKKVGIHTLAEGVETEHQLSFLRSIGCEKVQGFYFDKPLPIEDVIARFDSGRFVSETRSRRDYYETIGRVNMLSQAPMEYFARLGQRETETNRLFSGTPLAIAECENMETFRYLVANDMYLAQMEQIGRRELRESSDQINALPEEFKEVFRNGLRESKKTGDVARAEFVIDGRTYVTKMQYITSVENRDALLIALAGKGDGSLQVL